MTYICLILLLIMFFIIIYKGIPLLDKSYRETLAKSPLRVIHVIYGMSAILLYIYHRRLFYPIFPIIILMSILTGFKSDFSFIFLSLIIYELIYGKRYVRVLIFISILIIILLITSYIILKEFYSGWNMNVLLYPIYRIYFTMKIFEYVILHEKIEYKVILTKTLLGEAYKLLNILGIFLLSLFYAIYFSIIDNIKKMDKFKAAIVSMITAHTILLIEIGFQPASLAFYLFSLIFL